MDRARYIVFSAKAPDNLDNAHLGEDREAMAIPRKLIHG
jgi:hypothetical protein